jgi:hypothetical protein
MSTVMYQICHIALSECTYGKIGKEAVRIAQATRCDKQSCVLKMYRKHITDL